MGLSGVILIEADRDGAIQSMRGNGAGNVFQRDGAIGVFDVEIAVDPGDIDMAAITVLSSTEVFTGTWIVRFMPLAAHDRGSTVTTL